MNNDIDVLRDLARQYAQIANDPIQQQKRDLWRRHNSQQKTRPLFLMLSGFWDLWCRQHFSDATMKCQDGFFRGYEKSLRFMLFHAGWGDDHVFEPWITVPAAQLRGWNSVWGAAIQHESLNAEGGAWHFDPVIREWSDTAKLSWPPHKIDEAKTAANAQKLGDAIGDIIAINRERGPMCTGFMGDLVMQLAQLRGLEQLMVDMCESPQELHKLMAWMRDGVLANQAAAEKAGDLSRTSQQNQAAAYSDQTLAPTPNVFGAARKDLWCFCAAQELTGVSPAMHEEFLLQYQRPIIEHWGLCAYGCCEDLTRKIDMLRSIKNLRIIAVTPRADVRRCAEQIGTDYVMSWRPNPTDMLCYGFDENRIRRILREGLTSARGGYVHVNLKDIYTVEGDVTRFARWAKIAREECEKANA